MLIFAALKPLQPFLWLEDLPFPVNGGPGNYTELCLTMGWEDHGVHGGCLLTTWDVFFGEPLSKRFGFNMWRHCEDHLVDICRSYSILIMYNLRHQDAI